MPKPKNSAKLIKLYAAMSELTAPECRCTCRVPYSCCDPMYCELTLIWAKEHWGVELERPGGLSTRGDVLPLLGPKGCIAALHLRPICTLHTCQINAFACKLGDPKWTERYFILREQLEALEATGALEKAVERV